MADDLDSLFDDALADIQKRASRKKKTKQAASTAAKVIAKSRKSSIPVPRKLKNPLDEAQVVFFKQYTCRCGTTHTSCEYEGGLFIKQRLTSNTHQYRFIPAQKYDGEYSHLPQKVEMKYISISHCPACVKQEVEDEFLIRAFDLHRPKQEALDFDKWLYPVDKFPLAKVTS